jgi:hypothetical protein
VGRACGMHGRGEKSVKGFGGHRWEDRIRMYLRESGWWSVDWIRLAEDRDQWWAVVNAVMNFQVLVPQSELVTLCLSSWYLECSR